MVRALKEFRIRGVKTNIPFLVNVLEQEKFVQGAVDTNFIDEHPELFKFPHSQNRAQKLLSYLAELKVNGPLTPLVTDLLPKNVSPIVPHTPADKKPPSGFRDVLLNEGPAAFAKAIRNHKGTLLTDTT